MTQPYTIYENPILFRIYPSQQPEKPAEKFLLLHGWSGNESSMSIFLNTLPKNHFSISPRGIFPISADRYGWLNIADFPSPSFSDFSQPADLVMEKLNTVSNGLTNNSQKKWNVIGFSQGAALASVLAVRYPGYFHKICLLSGFLPNQPPHIEQSLAHLEVFISHGRNDSLVPFEQALVTKTFFSQIGASVDFCEEEQSHKIGAACSINLRKFLNAESGTLQE